MHTSTPQAVTLPADPDTLRQIASLSIHQAAGLARTCRGVAAGARVAVWTGGQDQPDGTLRLELEIALSPDPLSVPMPASNADPDGLLFTLTAAQAARLTLLCPPVHRALARLDVFAPALAEPAGTLLLEVETTQQRTSAWTLGADGRLAPPHAALGDAIVWDHEPDDVQATAALLELYRFAPGKALCFRPRLETAIRDAPQLDETDRRQLFRTLAHEMLRALDRRQPISAMTCRTQLEDGVGHAAIGWGLREDPDLTLIRGGCVASAA